MNAHKLEAVLAEDGKLVLDGLPFDAGASVEVIILERSSKPQASKEFNLAVHPLQGAQPYRYDDPFEPAVPIADWDVLK